MDSLTQIVLGAAVGEILLGRQLGNKAMLLGAIGGTIPDLDVAYNLINNDPIRQLQVHRGYSHSVFTHFVLSAPLAWISNRWSKAEIPWKKWYWFWFWCLFTHALLDCCTTYGTQLFKPFTNYQVGFNNISVIDPLYTIPFLLLLSGCLFFKRTSDTRRTFLRIALATSGMYMLATFFIKWHVHTKFRSDLDAKGVVYDELNSTPTILNAVLWSAIAYNQKEIYVAEYSLAWEHDNINWITYQRNLDLLPVFNSKPLETVIWFSDGNYFTEKLPGDTLAFYNIKWGRTRFDTTSPDSAFLFYWKFFSDEHEIRYKQVEPTDWKFSEAFDMLLRRIGE